MCRLATGGGISGRSLYTNADEFVYFLKRPQVTTGIPKLADRADFAARWLQITMPRIPEDKRVSEEDFEAEGRGPLAAHSRAAADHRVEDSWPTLTKSPITSGRWPTSRSGSRAARARLA